MAQFNSTTFGSISGRHGSVVAVTTKDGKSYLRLYRAPSNPKTEKQVAQRAKFAYANKTLSCFGQLFKETFNNSKGKSTGISHALKNAIVGEAPDFSIDYSKLLFTLGSINKAINTALTVDNLTVSLNWDFVIGSNSKALDSLNIIFFNEETQLSVHLRDMALRSDKMLTYELPEVWKGSTVHCWIYFTAINGSSVSTSESPVRKLTGVLTPAHSLKQVLGIRPRLAV